MQSVGLNRVVCAAALASLLSGTPASAQGFFDFLFGGHARRETPQVRSYADPNSDRSDSGVRRSERPANGEASVSGQAYCVRLCDGRYFPISVRGSGGTEICKSFCPAAATKVFSGGDLRYAAASDGKRYSDLPNAYVYREKLVAGCTCDGKSPTGLVRIDPRGDPTIRPGDIVATGQGLMAYRGGYGADTEFTAISNTPGISANLRAQLSATRVSNGKAPLEERPDPEADGEAMMSRNVGQRDQAAR